MTNKGDQNSAEPGRKDRLWPADWLAEHLAQVEAHERRKSQVGIYHGIGPEPKRSSGRWEDWIETLYMACDWEKVPSDWKVGDPRDPKTQAEIEDRAKLQTDYQIKKAMEAARTRLAPK